MRSAFPRFDLLYCECWGDIVGSFEHWASAQDDASSPVVTYSSQFFEFARATGARTYAMSGCPRPARVERANIVVAHHRRMDLDFPFIGYHLSQLRYALLLLGLAVRYRPRTLVVDSGVTQWVFLAPMRLLGVRVIAVLHNSLWPNSFPPTRAGRRWLLAADRLFFRHIASAVFCVSPVIARQVRQVAGARPPPIVEFGARFEARHFPPVHTALSPDVGPFKVLFVGRVERNKGVFDLLEAARSLEGERPGSFQFDVCGDGDALPELAQAVARLDLGASFRLHGRLRREAILDRYREAHIVVVPTRSDFCEGFAQVVAEAVLLARPVVTNAVVPALESLREAIVEVRADDPASLADGIRSLAGNPRLRAEKVAACLRYRAWLLDVRRSFFNQLIAHRSLILP